MTDKVEKKRLAILSALRDARGPVCSSKITDELTAAGYDLSERTVRFHLKSMDELGLTENLGRKGRAITDLGLDELAAAKVIEKVGFLSARIEQMAYAVDFDVDAIRGGVVVNVSLFDPDQLLRCTELMMRVYEKGLAMGRLLTLIKAGERIGEVTIPQQMVGLGTVCSVTLNGVLLQHGIPTTSRFGGLLEMRDSRPTRFLELIAYDGTSLDPLEIFVHGGMTDYTGAATTGNGRIGASFREFPAVSRDRVTSLAARLGDAGLGSLMNVGWPGQPLLDIPVHEGRFGAVVIGGLNPVAAAEEQGERVRSRALAGVVDYGSLFPYEELEGRLREMA